RRVRQVEARQPSRPRLEKLEPVDRLTGEDTRDAALVEERVARQVEDPLRVAELALLAREGVNLTVPFDVEVRPAGSVGDEEQRAVRAPLGLEDRLRLGAGNASRVRARTVALEVPDAEIGALERHVRVVPGQPRKPAAVSARTRCGVEVATVRDHTRLARAVGL